jgi:hypothetical protein
MVVGQKAITGIRQIFLEKPHSTWDNYFSGDDVMDFLGERGFAATIHVSGTVYLRESTMPSFARRRLFPGTSMHA